MSLNAVLQIDSGTGSRTLRLADYLDPAAEEEAARDTYAWIKSLRHARVGGDTLRQRFTYRGDSFWWFAELYLHKERAILTLFRAIRAAEALVEREHPLSIDFVRGDRAVRTAVAAAAGPRRIRCAPPPAALWHRVAAMDARSAALAVAAHASPRRPPAAPRLAPAIVAAFVHRAFWRDDTGDGSGESYIGPVLKALEERLPAGAIRYAGMGPPTNFRARRWWKRGRDAGRHVIPVERLAPRSALRGSWGVWRSRHAVRRELAGSRDIREAAVLRGCDCWPVVREALDGIALLQLPWSARAMDEAGCALDALRPRVALTYAEAGGWGRALVLEARRRGIPVAGLQHGFIYRHWLNYRHEADEMHPPAAGSADRGFPLPDRTLVFDHYAAEHLAAAGRFPPAAVVVTGSPRLDVLAAEVAALPEAAVESVRRQAGANTSEPLILIVSKFTEMRAQLRPLLDAVRELPQVRAVIKTHPAETSAPYEAAAAGMANLRVLPASAPLAPLLRAAQVIVTVNSTVAIDGLVVGVPALAIGRPNNLDPFIDAGAMAGTTAPGEIAPALRRVLYDRGFRQQLEAGAAAAAARYGLAARGDAAERSAAAILELAASPQR